MSVESIDVNSSFLIGNFEEQWQAEEIDMLTDTLFDCYEVTTEVATENKIDSLPITLAEKEDDPRSLLVVSPTSSDDDDSRAPSPTTSTVPTATTNTPTTTVAVNNGMPMPIPPSLVTPVSSEMSFIPTSSSSATVMVPALMESSMLLMGPATAAVAAAASAQLTATNEDDDAKDNSNKEYIPIAPAPVSSLASSVSTSSAKNNKKKNNSKRSRTRSAKERFLQVVALHSEDATSGSSNKRAKTTKTTTASEAAAEPFNINSLPPAEQVQYRKERNRVLAKQTRDRKRAAFANLKQEFLDLHKEHQQLQDIVKQHNVPTPQNKTTTSALDRIPKEVWNVCEMAPPASAVSSPSIMTTCPTTPITTVPMFQETPNTHVNNLALSIPTVDSSTDVNTLAMLAGVPNPLFCT